VLGIEFMAAAQALDFREFTRGRGVRTAHQVVREHVLHLEEDRPLFSDHDAMKKLVKDCTILQRVEEEIGPLE
jgi:histidine ammonia-lyase